MNYEEIEKAWKNLTKVQQKIEYQNFENFKKIYLIENQSKIIKKKNKTELNWRAELGLEEDDSQITKKKSSLPKKINLKKELKILNENQKLTKVKRAWKNLTKVQQKIEYQNFENFKKIYFEENNFKDINKMDPNSSSEGVGTRTKAIVWMSIIFIGIFSLMIVSNSNYDSDSNYKTSYSFFSKRVVCTSGGCVIKCTYSGGKYPAWRKFYDDGYHVSLPRWGCPSRLDVNGYPVDRNGNPLPVNTNL